MINGSVINVFWFYKCFVCVVIVVSKMLFLMFVVYGFLFEKVMDWDICGW